MRVVVADDVMLTREGIIRLLTDAGVDVVGEAGDAASLLRGPHDPARRRRGRHPHAPTHTDEGLVAAQQIRAEHPDTGVLILSQYVEPHYAMRLIEEHPERVGYLQVRTVCRAGHLGGDRRGLRPYAGPASVLSCVVSAQAGMATVVGRPSVDRVCGPTVPSTGMCSRCCQVITASRVAGP
jgi:hypothetical protein